MAYFLVGISNGRHLNSMRIAPDGYLPNVGTRKSAQPAIQPNTSFPAPTPFRANEYPVMTDPVAVSERLSPGTGTMNRCKELRACRDLSARSEKKLKDTGCRYQQTNASVAKGSSSDLESSLRDRDCVWDSAERTPTSVRIFLGLEARSCRTKPPESSPPDGCCTSEASGRGVHTNRPEQPVEVSTLLPFTNDCFNSKLPSGRCLREYRHRGANKQHDYQEM